jgi:hypothetical protein
MFWWWNDPGLPGFGGVNSRMLRIGTAFLIPLMLLCSCEVIDLRPIGVQISPGEPYGILADYYTPVILNFDTEMIKNETEQVITVSFSGGSVEGDLRWEGNTLFFTPVAGWTAGRRYTLSLMGQIYSVDGRELRLARYIPFFAVSRSELPGLESFFPADGASVGVTPEDGGVVILNFSMPMDRRSTEEGFSISGIGDKTFEWEEDDRILRIRPDKALSPWTNYRWSLDHALSREGAPLAKPVSAQFVTDLDRSHPLVLEVFPLLPADPPNPEDGRDPAFFLPWVRTGARMEDGLGIGQGIGIQFNKPMDKESLRKAVRLEPALSGRIELLNEDFLVYVPDKDPECETRYTLIISGDTQDKKGLRMGEDFITYFTPDIPLVRISSLFVNTELVSMPEGGEGPRSYTFYLEGTASAAAITLVFSLPFSQEAMVTAALEIALDPWFPASISSAVLKTATWSSEDTLRLEWEGLEPGNSGEPHFYRFTIPGGKNGITNGRGSYMKNTQTIYLEVLEL